MPVRKRLKSRRRHRLFGWLANHEYTMEMIVSRYLTWNSSRIIPIVFITIIFYSYSIFFCSFSSSFSFYFSFIPWHVDCFEQNKHVHCVLPFDAAELLRVCGLWKSRMYGRQQNGRTNSHLIHSFVAWNFIVIGDNTKYEHWNKCSKLVWIMGAWKWHVNALKRIHQSIDWIHRFGSYLVVVFISCAEGDREHKLIDKTIIEWNELSDAAQLFNPVLCMATQPPIDDW